MAIEAPMNLPPAEDGSSLIRADGRLLVLVRVLSQADLRAAMFALHRAADEAAGDTRLALERVENALWDITNHRGTEAIASDAILGTQEIVDPGISRGRGEMPHG